MRIFRLSCTFLIASLLMAACGAAAAPPAAEPGPEALPTAAAAPTDAELPTVSSPQPDAGFIPQKLAAPNCAYGGAIQSIEALDEHTVKITLCGPDAAFPAKIASPAFGIQPSEHLDAANGSPLANPTGTGPYQLAAWNHGEDLTLTRFDSYWGEKAQTPSLVFRWQPDPAIRLLELQSGTIDGMDEPHPDDFAAVEADPNLQLIRRSRLDVLYLALNTTQAPLDNEKTRQALAMSLDREAITRAFAANGVETASHFAPCEIPNGCAGDAWYGLDIPQGQALLKEVGQESGFPLKITYAEFSPGLLPRLEAVATEIQAQLKTSLNIEVEIVVLQPAEYLSAIAEKKLEGLSLLAWSANYPDQADFLNRHFGGQENPLSDLREALTQALARAGDQQRQPHYQQANNLIREHVPVIPLLHTQSAAAYKKSVTGPQASPLSAERFSQMSSGMSALVWMQALEPASLYCADEVEPGTLRICSQITESLLRYQAGGAGVEPALAESYQPNAALTEWTFTLRPDVLFHDGSTLDANDVVTSLAAQWDASHPLHTGNTGAFAIWKLLFGNFLNQPK